MPLQPLDCRSCALSIHSALSAGPPSLGTISEDEENPTGALGLLSQLLQHSFLNGACSEDSVWTALDNLVPPSLSRNASTSTPFFTLSASQTTNGESVIEALDDGSICVSFPLNFQTNSTEKSVVEVIEIVPHRVELVEVTNPVESKKKGGTDAVNQEGATKGEGDGKKWWDFEWLRNHGDGKERGEAVAGKVIVAKKIFDPPKDRLSIRATWWGYEIYLPEPVFVDFGNDVEPVLTALTYLSTGLALLLTKAPLAIVALPGFPLLQSLVPIFSAIISAVTWYWKVIKKMDLGEGIILSATWVLPVAVVPRPLKRKKSSDEEDGQGAGSIIELRPTEKEKVEVEESNVPSVEPEKRKPNKLRRVLSGRARK